MKLKIAIIILLFMITFNLSAGRYAGEFMVIGSGVRSSGMGKAFTALANDGSAIYWNASGIAQLRSTEIGLMRAFLYSGLASYDNFSVCQPLPNEVTIGFNWTRLSIDDIPVFLEEHLVGNPSFRSSYFEYNLTGIPDGKITSTDDLLQFAFAKHIHYDLDLGWLFFDVPFDLYFGGNIKYIKRKIDESIGNGTGFDFSLLARTSLSVILERDWMGDIALGINFQDIGGTDITWAVVDDDSDHKDEVIMNSKLGVAITQPIPRIYSSIVLSHDIDYIYNKIHHTGFEFQYKDFLELRLGYYDTNFTTGITIIYKNFSLDYAFLTNNLASTNRVGLRVKF
ncbi:MAG: hypothetical protein K9N07_02960 [Candidatus Cloacimonetes bacterium]|nr:hypothetical protein [Candidatus Cloacimonadota bacterium]